MRRSPVVGGLRPLLVLLVVAVALLPGRALAFPWMIHHGYVNCAQCHVDPAGAGILTDYGRAQGEILLRTHYKPLEEDPGKKAEFAFGILPLPVPLELQADVRPMLIPEPGNVRFLLMQADLRAALVTGPLVASASVGTVNAGAQGAWITRNDPGFNLVSREYWLGVQPAKGWMIRAGRMNLPFGLRTEDHILKVRSATRTTINDDQQLGASVGFTSKSLRAEAMWIAGNYSVAPDEFRERGYSGYLAWAPNKDLVLGASSLLTVAKLDVDTLLPRTRQAHGLYTVASPVEPLAIMAEADLLLDTIDGQASTGLTSSLVLDWEPTQGVHVQGIGEYCDADFASPTSTYTAGAAAQWFFTSRLDLRADVLYGMLYCTAGSTAAPLALVQAHFYL